MAEFTYCPVCRTPLIDAERGGSLRRACPADGCSFVHWNNPVPVAAAIVEQNGKIILVRSIGWPDGYYGLVAGYVEPGEHPRTAALREVSEETGLTAANATRVGTYPFSERNQLLFVYHIQIADGPITLCKRELLDYRAVPIPSLIPWSRGTGPALRDWLAANGFEREMVPFGSHLTDGIEPSKAR